ncbi:MAG: hypothetical protein JNK04_04345 [Myxococcales bacterium]|nr:hypothetical protein [Myxococcales bacterium]
MLRFWGSRGTRLRAWLAMMVALAAGCGDSSGIGGNSSGGASEGAGTSEGGSGGGVPCTPLEVDTFAAERATLFVSNVTLGGDNEDLVGLYVVEGDLGLTALSMVASVHDCSASVPCVSIAEDVADVDVGALFYANTGQLNITASAPYAASGSLLGVTLVEVTVDEEGAVSVVPGGRCFDLADVVFELPSPADGWACSPLAYDETSQGVTPPECECTCGTADPDCAVPANTIADCLEGQTCGPGGCEGVPAGWTCSAGQYAGGSGNGCDCDCGIPDPDCDLPGEAIDNCPANNECNAWAVCVPSAWACSPDYYGDESCDCGCGSADPDCPDLAAASCDVCAEAGSCANEGLTPFGCDLSLLDPGNNGLCL